MNPYDEPYDLKHYDLIVKCNNLRDLNGTGWPVVTKVGKFTSESEAWLKVVGISGCYNVGKSFVLNNLGAKDLPSCDKLHTEGLSVRFLNEGIALIDTAGTNSPITVSNQQCLSDRICMEKILANCLQELADFHICVVNKLTWQDQQHYELLFDSINRTTELWPLIVIHNFRDNKLSDLKYLITDIRNSYPQGKFKANRIDISLDKAEGLFNQQIDTFIREYGAHKNSLDQPEEKIIESEPKKFKIWSPKRKTSNGQIKEAVEVPMSNEEYVKLLRLKFAQEPMIWFDSRGDDKCRHFFLVNNEGAGKEFNFKTFTHIKEIYAQVVPKKRIFSIRNIGNALDTYSRRYLRFKNLGQIDNLSTPILDFVQDIKTPKSQADIVLHHFVLNNELRPHTIVLKNLYELEYHNLFLGATQWNPRYDIVYKKNGEVDSCLVVIELPGEIKDYLDYVIEKDPNTNRIIINFSGQPLQEHIYRESTKIIKGRRERHFTKFDFKVTIPGEYDANLTQPEVGYENGVYWIGLEKRIQKHSGKIKATS